MGAPKFRRQVIIFLLFTIFWLNCLAHDEFVDVIAKAKPAVVIIEVSRSKNKTKIKKALNELGESANFFEDELSEMPRKGRGSGFLLKSNDSNSGFSRIMTAAHVVRKASVIKIVFSNGKRAKAEVVWIDNKRDLALLKVKSDKVPDYGLQLSSDRALEGQSVVSIAGSFDLPVSSSKGIVSAVDVVLPDKRKLKLIQTDAAINPGSSGGPLINSDGDVLGVISNIYSKTGTFSGTAFAVPSLTVLDLLQQ